MKYIILNINIFTFNPIEQNINYLFFDLFDMLQTTNKVYLMWLYFLGNKYIKGKTYF